MKRITALTELTALLALWMFTALTPSAAEGAVPQLINFQGILRDGSGNPVADGSYSVVFTIYDAASGGTNLWSETQSVSTTNGLFNTQLGSVTPISDAIFSDSSRYLGVQVGADPEMMPRQKLVSVGYGYRVGTVDGATGGTINGELNIQGNSTQVSNVASMIFRNAAGVYLGSVGDLYFADNDIGLFASDGAVKLHTATGWALIATRFGDVVIGTTGPLCADCRLSVQENSSDGAAISGYATGITGKGVVGQADNGDAAFGVWGISAAGYAGYFSGNAHVAGTLTKTAGSFKIDHPTDPANKYLYHSFVESPDMMNIYNGNVTLDSKGEAVIALPDWFGALNKDFRYQLTAIGAPGPNLYIAHKVSNNQFRIAGGIAGMEVSWQVTGIRQDAYANAHRIPVEELKPDKERGYYLHPNLFNQPEEKQIDWARDPEMMGEIKKRNLQAEQK